MGASILKRSAQHSGQSEEGPKVSCTVIPTSEAKKSYLFAVLLPDGRALVHQGVYLNAEDAVTHGFQLVYGLMEMIPDLKDLEVALEACEPLGETWKLGPIPPMIMSAVEPLEIEWHRTALEERGKDVATELLEAADCALRYLEAHPDYADYVRYLWAETNLYTALRLSGVDPDGPLRLHHTPYSMPEGDVSPSTNIAILTACNKTLAHTYSQELFAQLPRGSWEMNSTFSHNVLAIGMVRNDGMLIDGGCDEMASDFTIWIQFVAPTLARFVLQECPNPPAAIKVVFDVRSEHEHLQLSGSLSRLVATVREKAGFAFMDILEIAQVNDVE